MKKRLAIALALVSLTACQQKKSTKTHQEYGDIKGFFTAEASRLNAQKPTFTKTVGINGVLESKLLNQSIDWEKELSVFFESDINKPALKGAFKVSEDKYAKIYTALSEAATIQRIELDINVQQKITGVRIYKRTQNLIYTSMDTLSYYPDSLYCIHKKQEVRVLGTTYYTIDGKFN